MCYSALVKKDLGFLETHFGATIVRETFDDYARAVAIDPKTYPPLEYPRIFPGHYAPVAVKSLDGDERTTLVPMRYGIWPPAFVDDPKRYAAFNARRDNLASKFWSEAVSHHHGLIVLEGFFEWVKVANLVRAGVVALREVTDEFARQSEERKQRILAAGKKWKPTLTETKDPMLRDIVIRFRPVSETTLNVPVVCTIAADPNHPGGSRRGFAIVTDDPQPEVLAAGHDRCPIFLSDGAAREWLDAVGKSTGAAEQILRNRRLETLAHGLAASA